MQATAATRKSNEIQLQLQWKRFDVINLGTELN